MKKILLVSIIALTASCTSQTIHVNPMENGIEETKTFHMSPFLIGGIGQSDEVNAADICKGPENVVKINTKQSALDIAISWITGFLVTPRDYSVWCKYDKETYSYKD